MNMNKRVVEKLHTAEQVLQALRAILEDLDAREGKPTFAKAEALFAEGWRLKNWGALLTDTHEETILTRGGEIVGYWADGSNRNTEEAFQLLSL